MNEPFRIRTYVATALDPIHVGTGGYRLGRVDNTIVREPGTNLPKLPGSSIAGVARAWTALAIQSVDPLRQKYLRQEENGLSSCAGKGGDDGTGHCGRYDCEVCIAYGFSKRDRSFQGLAQFTDAHILFFPVASMAGPVWITSPAILSAAGIAFDGIDPDGWDRSILKEAQQDVCWSVSPAVGTHINLGWLYLKKTTASTLGPPAHVPILGPEQWTISLAPGAQCRLGDLVSAHVLGKLIMVSDHILSRVINDNLEVRTSVAIDPSTGAAAEKALFTYEAIPRGTVMTLNVTVSNPSNFRIPSDQGQERAKKRDGTDADLDWIFEQVEKGFAYFASLGVGGMNTRGMGRLRIQAAK